METRRVDFDYIPSAVRKWARMSALDSTHDFRLGAVVYRRHYPIGSGCNEGRKTTPRSPHPYYAIHAEVAAVVSAARCLGWKEFDDCSIYVHRIKKDNSVAMAKPCKYCMGMLVNLNFKSVAYSIGDGIVEIIS